MDISSDMILRLSEKIAARNISEVQELLDRGINVNQFTKGDRFCTEGEEREQATQ